MYSKNLRLAFFWKQANQRNVENHQNSPDTDSFEFIGIDQEYFH